MRKKRAQILTELNDWVHKPVWEDLTWTFYWLMHCMLSPFYAVFLIALFVHKAVTGALVPKLEEPSPDRPILITGCDTGFGHELALELYTRGWKVYAGCLTDAGLNSLSEKAGGGGANNTMIAVKMDVTKQADIERVVEQIKEENPAGLYALVCNAGVGRGGLVDWMPMHEYRNIFEVNFFSMVAMVKTCLPLLKKCRGRIVNVTSFAGLFHGAPCMSAYCASKHASEAFTSSLRMEMKGWGIKVVTVNPSFHKTLIATNGAETLQRSFDALDREMQEEYGQPYLRVCRSISNRANKSSWDPKNVVQALVNATTATKPRIQYIVGGDAKFALLPLLNLPTDLVEDLVSYVLCTRLVPARAKKERMEREGGPAASETPIPPVTTSSVPVPASSSFRSPSAAGGPGVEMKENNNGFPSIKKWAILQKKGGSNTSSTSSSSSDTTKTASFSSSGSFSSPSLSSSRTIVQGEDAAPRA